jgi:hypothetical protein
MKIKLIFLSLILSACGGLTANNASLTQLSSDAGPGAGNEVILRSIHLNGVELKGQVLELGIDESEKSIIQQ